MCAKPRHGHLQGCAILNSMKGESGFQLQERDLELLRSLFECRVMTIRHMSKIHFGGHFEATRKRARRLRDEGFIAERPSQRGTQSIFLITQRGFNILVNHGQLAHYPNVSWPIASRRAQVSDLTLRHELLVLDVKAALFTAARYRPSLTFTQFSTWPRLSQFNVFHLATGEKVMIKPDGFIQLCDAKSDRVKGAIFFPGS